MASNGISNPPSSRLSKAQSGIASVRDGQSPRDSTKKSFAEYYREYRARTKDKVDGFRDVLNRRKPAAEHQHEYRVRKEAEKSKQSKHDTRSLDSINIDPHATTRRSIGTEQSRTANPSTSDGSSASNSKIASIAKKRAKTSAEKSRDYRARKKAKSGNISKNTETTASTTMKPSTTAHSHTNHGPSTSAATIPKRPRRRESKLAYQREYRARLKFRRLNGQLHSTSGGSTASAKSSSTITERTKDRTNGNIENASGDYKRRNESIDDTRTDRDTQSNPKLPLTNNSPSKGGVIVANKRRGKKTAAQSQPEYRDRVKSRGLNNSLNSTSGGSTKSAKSSTITEMTNGETNANIENVTRDNIPRNKRIRDTRTDHDTPQSNRKLLLTNHSPSRSGVIIPNKSRRRKSAAQHQRDYLQRLKSRRIKNSSNSTTNGSITSAKSSSTIKDATRDDISRNKNTNDTRTDRDTRSNLKLLLTNHSPSRSGVVIPNKPRKRKSRAQYQRDYRQRLKSRRIDNSSNSTTDASITSAKPSSTIKDATGDKIPTNNNIDDKTTDHDTRSNLQLPLTNYGPSSSAVEPPNESPGSKSAEPYQRDYRQRLRSRRINNSLNSTIDGSTTSAESSPTITRRTRAPVVIPELLPNRRDADPGSEVNDDLRSATSSRPRSIVASRENVMLSEEFLESMRKTNVLQRSISLEIIDHLASDQLRPLRVFLTGAAGRGKTFVIRLILELYHKYATTSCHCNAYLICALTGKAAVAINGPTVHTALSLSTGVGSGLSAEILNQFRSLFQHIRVVIIDEVSALGSELLDRVDRRLKLITGKSKAPFGGLDIILIGDPTQPSPVKAAPIHKQSKYHMDLQTWRSFTFLEVTEVIRQSNVLFSAILTKIANEDQLNKEETTLLESTFVTEAEANRLCPRGLRLAYFNKTVDVYNRLILKNDQEKIVSEAADFISGCKNDEEREKACRALENSNLAAETGELPQSLTFVLGKYYTLTTDVAVADGLAKGTMGKLAHIESKNDDGEVTRVWLLFPASETIGTASRTAMSAFMIANDIDPLAVPIDRLDETFYLNRRRTIAVRRNHFPLAPGCSVKVKKSPIGSFDEVVYYYDKSQSKPLVYVAMSRVTSIEGLYIIPVNKRTEFYHGYASNDHSSVVSQNEMTRLDRSSLDLLKQELLEPVDSKSGLSVG